MTAVDNEKDAKATADHVKEADHGGQKGAGDAYKALNTEVQTHYDQIGKNGYTQEDFKNYQNALVKDLQANGTLPDLSLSWASENQSLLHKLSSKQEAGDNGANNLPDAGISHDAIPAIVSLQQNQFNSALIKAYGDQLEKGGTFDAATGSTGGDIGHNAYLGPKSIASYFEQSGRVTENRGMQAKDADGHVTSSLGNLFKTGPNGESPLIQQLDTAKSGGKPDGNISSDDMDAWLRTHDAKDANYQLVKDLKDGKYDGLKTRDGKDKVSDGFNVDELTSDLGITGISKGDIESGKKKYSDLAAAYDTTRGSDAVAKAAVEKGADGQINKLTYDNGRIDAVERDSTGNINRITETPAKGGAPVVYKADDKGNWGPVKADGSVDISAGNKSPVITEGGQLAFQTGSGKWVVIDDHGNTVPPSGDISFTQHSLALDKQGNPIPGQKLDSHITVNSSSEVTQITYPGKDGATAGPTSKFTYDATDPTKLVSVSRSGDAANKDAEFVKDADGKWVVADADHKPTKVAAKFSDISVDSSGNVSVKGGDGKTIVITPDNVGHKDSATGAVIGSDAPSTPAATTDKTPPATDKTPPVADPNKPAAEIPFETKTDDKGATTFNLTGGSGHWLWNYADQLAKANGKDTNEVLDAIVKANRGKNGISADATGAKPGNYHKGEYTIPADLVPPKAEPTPNPDGED
ncbi:hypothetical protein BH10CYA1_BH10CYA1_20560 [soil metagenome]